jgi:hypothetical protein
VGARGNVINNNLANSVGFVNTNTNRRPLLQNRLVQLAPAPAKDCGHVPTSPAATVVSCVEAAIREKTPFLASFAQSAGNEVILGLASPVPGKIAQVIFDLNQPPNRVSDRPDCVDPQFKIAGQIVSVTCR